MLKKCPLCADNEDELVLAVWLYFAQVRDQLNCIAPTQVSRQLTAKKALMQQLKVVPDVCAHHIRMALAWTTSCIPLLVPEGRPSIRLSKRAQLPSFR
jgi:hypothetical protein